MEVIIFFACLGFASMAMAAAIILKSNHKALGGVFMGFSISCAMATMIGGGPYIAALVANCVATGLCLIYVLMIE